MSDIYQRATAIIMWLGPEADNSNTAMKTIIYLYHVGTEDFQQMQITTPMRFNPRLLGPADRPFSGETWQAVQKLLHRPRWNRAWVIQEATAPKDHPWKLIVRCGREWAPCGVFGIALLGLRRIRRETEQFPDIQNHHLDSLTIIRQQRDQFSGSRDLDLMRLLQTTRYCEASDPRDKIFARLSLANDGDHPDLQADTLGRLSMKYISA